MRIIVGDCLERLKLLDDETIDVIVTSPPYNIGIKYSSYDDSLDQSEYLQWIGAVFRELKRVLKPNGSLFLNVGNQNAYPWLTTDILMTLRPLFHLQNNITWVKSISIGDDSHGHFKPISSPRFLNNLQENIFHLTKTGQVAIDRLAVGVPFKYKSNIARFGDEGRPDKRCAGNVWYIPYKTVQTKAGKHHHPAAFPEGLPERCIRLHGGNDLVVLDPFLGSGTTLVAAAKLGHSGIGIELDPTYAAVAEERITEIRSHHPSAEDNQD